MESDIFHEIPIPALLDQLSDGVILLRDGRVVSANKRARELLGFDPIGRTMFTLLSSADVDLLHPDADSALTYHLEVADRWITLTVRHLDATASSITLREDREPASREPFPIDEDDLTWLRVIAARLALFSELHQKMEPAELKAELRKYADQLGKYVSNGSIRLITDATSDAVFPIVGLSFDRLLTYAKDSIGEKLAQIGVKLHYTPVNQVRGGVIFASLQFFVKLVYSAIDALIYHSKEAAPDRPIDIVLGEGESGGRLYLRFSFTAVRAFPTDRESLDTWLRQNPAAFPPAYVANVKLVWALVKLYHGMMTVEARGDRHELRLYFQQSPTALAAPYDPADCQVHPETEFADVIYDLRFQIDR